MFCDVLAAMFSGTEFAASLPRRKWRLVTGRNDPGGTEGECHGHGPDGGHLCLLSWMLPSKADLSFLGQSLSGKLSGRSREHDPSPRGLSRGSGRDQEVSVLGQWGLETGRGGPGKGQLFWTILCEGLLPPAKYGDSLA